ncbi:MAG TPA: DUF488 domain-containing protein [Nitrospira sp.]|nr:DUF488 domain-containing protein [Nitrospira sp.]
MSQLLWTIGHSTRPIDEFVSLLKAHGIQQLVDVRTVPRSRHNPQFNIEALSRSLTRAAIHYRHSGNLGGLRKPKKDSINTGWRNASFRGYADYMQTEEFRSALDELMAESRSPHTAIMCAEAVPWRCHRSLIADALVTRDWEVRHIMSETKADRHRLTPFATVENGLLRYPGPDCGSLFP